MTKSVWLICLCFLTVGCGHVFTVKRGKSDYKGVPGIPFYVKKGVC